jgi:hypothetical protein
MANPDVSAVNPASQLSDIVKTIWSDDFKTMRPADSE